MRPRNAGEVGSGRLDGDQNAGVPQDDGREGVRFRPAGRCFRPRWTPPSSNGGRRSRPGSSTNPEGRSRMPIAWSRTSCSNSQRVSQRNGNGSKLSGAAGRTSPPRTCGSPCSATGALPAPALDLISQPDRARGPADAAGPHDDRTRPAWTAPRVGKGCPAAPSAASSHTCSFVEGALRVWFGTVLVLVNAGLYLGHLLLRGREFGSREPHRCSDRREAVAAGRLANT